MRLRLGLPVPTGIAGPDTAALGLDPAAPAAPDPGHVWSADALRDLITRAHQWCAAGSAHVALAGHQVHHETPR
jgi:hypothetical protein